MASILKYIGWQEVLIAAFTIFLLAYLYIRHCYNFWKRQGFNHVKGTFPFGNVKEWLFLKKFIGQIYADLYKEHEGQEFVGHYSFLQPVLIVRDLNVIKNVLVKDAYNFTNRGMYFNIKDDPLSAHLFALDGEEWKLLRSKLNPTFTSLKMKFMYPHMVTCSEQLLKYTLEVTEGVDAISFKEVISRHGINVIANTVMGLSGQSLWEDSDLAKYTMMCSDPNDIVQMFRFLLPMVSKSMPKLLRLRFTPPEVQDYFMEAAKKVISYREETKTVQNDFIQILIDLKNQKTENGENLISFEELVAQLFVFTFAGYESSAATMSFCLYELAMNAKIQQKLMDEVDSVGLNISYENLCELPYLDMVLKETLRKYPPGAFIFRECLDDYKSTRGLTIPAGMKLIVSILGLHRDEKYYPEPENFIPERFCKKDPYHKIEPFSYLPFGDGPRSCIAKQYGIVQNKLALLYLIHQFRIEVTEKTTIPVQLDKNTFASNPEGGMWLRLVNRRNN